MEGSPAGFLDKRSDGHTGSKLSSRAAIGNRLTKWNRRWFVLDAAAAHLSYYASADAAAEGREPLRWTLCDRCIVSRSTEGPHMFTLCSDERVLTLRASDEKVLRMWVLALINAGASTQKVAAPLRSLLRKCEDDAPLPARTDYGEASASVTEMPSHRQFTFQLLRRSRTSQRSSRRASRRSRSTSRTPRASRGEEAPAASEATVLPETPRPTSDTPRPMPEMPPAVGGAVGLRAPTLKERAAAWPATSPVTAEDDRPLVRDLLLQHERGLEALRSLVVGEPLYSPTVHDDLWLLRFLLSHKDKVAVAARAAASCMRYRHENGLDVLDAIAADEAPDATEQRLIDLTNTSIEDGSLSWYQPDPDRGVVMMCLARGMDLEKLSAQVDADEQARLGRRTREWLFQVSDRVTRRTGRLTKVAELIEVKGASMSKVMSGEWQKRDQALAKMTEDFYPQLIGAIYICHPPSWLLMMWRVVRPLFPKRLVAKVDFVSPSTKPEEAKRFRRFLTAADLPIRFGGENKTWPLPGRSGL